MSKKIIKRKKMTFKELLQKYEFKDINELDEFLMEHIPMIYDNGKWLLSQEWKNAREIAKYNAEQFEKDMKRIIEQLKKND